MANRKKVLKEADEQAEERDELIAQLEAVKPQTKLGAELLSLRLKMLREGQRLRTLEEINSELGREEYVDLP